MTHYTLQFEPIRFQGRMIPQGYLASDDACQALYYYSILARRMQERTSNDPNFAAILYEGELDENVNFRELFISIAKMYGVQPERMEKFWLNIDMQLVSEGCPKLEGRARFQWKPVVDTASTLSAGTESSEIS